MERFLTYLAQDNFWKRLWRDTLATRFLLESKEFVNIYSIDNADDRITRHSTKNGCLKLLSPLGLLGSQDGMSQIKNDILSQTVIHMIIKEHLLAGTQRERNYRSLLSGNSLRIAALTNGGNIAIILQQRSKNDHAGWEKTVFWTITRRPAAATVWSRSWNAITGGKRTFSLQPHSNPVIHCGTRV